MTSAARDAILEAAFRLFVERGYEATSLARILEAVPYSKGAVYHHFSGKEALLDAVIERFFTALVTEPSDPRPTEGVALAHRMVNDYVSAIESVATFASPAAYYSFLTSVAPRAGNAIRAAHSASREELATALRSRHETREAARDEATDLISLVEGAGMLMVVRGDPLDREALHAAVDRALSARSS